MKLLKKTLCVFLSALFMLSALSISFTAFAADSEMDKLYRTLAYSFFDYSTQTSGFTTTYTIKTIDDIVGGIPVKSIVGNMSQYDVSNDSQDYEYADSEGNPIRAIDYKHTVTAKDDAMNHIRTSVTAYMSIVDQIKNTKYGEVLRDTIPLISSAVKEQLKYYKIDGEYMFLDGYTYFVDGLGNLVSRSTEKTYEVVDGQIKYFKQSEDTNSDSYWQDLLNGNSQSTIDSISEQFKNGKITEKTLYEYCNIDSIINYFSGNCTSVNAGNWFHEFVFKCSTDIETVLTTTALVANDLTVNHYTVTWKNGRRFDDSGTKATYYFDSDKIEIGTPTVDKSRRNLSALKSAMGTYFATYYAADKLKNTTNADLYRSYYADITTYYDDFSALSNNAMTYIYGDDAYSYMNLVTQLTPIIGASSVDTYLPSHEYTKYKDNSGNNVTYDVTTSKITTIVSTIDDLLKSEKVGTIIKTFLNFDDPKYQGMAFYGITANTASEVLYQVIQNYVFNDSIINTLLKTIYPMVTNLLDDMITDDFIETTISDAVGSTFDSLVMSVLNYVTENDGWQKLIYSILLRSANVGLTPAGVAYIMQQNGYATYYSQAFSVLKAAKGGTSNIAKDADGETNLGDFYAIGVEGDEYCGARWKDVDFDNLYWGINGNRANFQRALSAILSPLASLLACILGNQRLDLFVGDLAIKLYLRIEGLSIYNDVLVPILEALEIGNITTPAAFISASSTYMGSKTAANCTNLINLILNPLLDWVENDVLNDPISIILGVLPNVSYILTSGAVMAILNGINIPLKLHINFGLGTSTPTLTTLNIVDLVGADKLAFLDSLQGILDMIGIGVNTGIPVIGYTAEGDSKVYRPDDAGYDANTMNVEVTTAYATASGTLSAVQDSEYTTEVTGLDADGNYNSYCIYNDIGWSNAAGYVVTVRNDENIDEYTNVVKAYYQYSYEVEAGSGETTIVRMVNKPDESTLPEGASEVTYVQEPTIQKKEVPLPAIMDYKLQACGTLGTATSVRTTALTMTNNAGESITWAANQRQHIVLNVNGTDTRGLVLLYIFRYLFSALNYRAYVDGEFNEYALLDGFGLTDTLEKDLFYGLKLEDIIGNVTLHPDEVIAALYELFYTNEFGSIWEVVETASGTTVKRGSDYTYDLDYVDYHTNELMDAAEEHNDYTYGTSVLYNEYWSAEDSKFVVDNLDGIVDNVFKMLKLDGMTSIGEYLESLLNENLFNNKMLCTIANALYGLLDGIDGVDLPTILNAALEVDYSKKALADALVYEFGTTTDVVSALLDQYNNAKNYKYTENTFKTVTTEVDENTGEDIVTTTYFDWGYDTKAITDKYSNREIFLRAISAIASPFAVLVKYLFCGENLKLLNLLEIPGYEGYYYAWIPLMEALGAGNDLVSYDKYFKMTYTAEALNGESVVFTGGADAQKSAQKTMNNCNAFYYLLKPLFSFVEELLANPVQILLKMIPNLMFFVSIGGLNDVLNNLIHFVYVLLDILQPVYDAYPLINDFLANLEIGGMSLNISVPLDFDFNQLINDLLSQVTDDIEINVGENKNITIGTKIVQQEVIESVQATDEDGHLKFDENGEPIMTTQTKMQQVLDEDGNPVIDAETGEVKMEPVTKPVEVDAHPEGKLKISLPYIDFTTLCAGTLQKKMSVSNEPYVYMNSSNGADFITLVLRMVVETLFYKDNADNIAGFLESYCNLDDDDSAFLEEIFDYLNDRANTAGLPDIVMKILRVVYTYLVPIADNLGDRFAAVDFSITDLFSSFSNTDQLKDYVSQLISAGGEPTSDIGKTISGFGKIIAKIKAFFEWLKLIFAEIFASK